MPHLSRRVNYIPGREAARRSGVRTVGASDSHREKWTSVEARGKRAKYHPISNCFQPAKSFSNLRFSGCTFKKDTTKSFVVSTPTGHQRSTARQSAGGVAYGGTTRGTERSRCKRRRPTEVCLVGPIYVLMFHFYVHVYVTPTRKKPSQTLLLI